MPTPPPALLAWLGDALLQCSALLAFALVAHRVLRRAPAAWRHALLLAAAVGVPLLFVLSASLPSWKLPRSETLSAPFQPTPAEVQMTTTFALGAPLVTIPSPTPEVAVISSLATTTARHEATPFAWLPALLVIWASGTIAIWLRMLVGILALARQRKGDQLATDAVRALVAAEARDLGIARPPEIAMLDADAMPMTWHLRHHVVALPTSMSDWPIQKQRRVIRHELAHVLRNDCRTAWIADVSLALTWFHPLAWLVRRALGRAREAACDDIALGDAADSANRDGYARDLLDVIAHHSRRRRGIGLALALAMASKRSGMRRRLDSILDPARDRRPVPDGARRWTMPVWGLGLAALASLAACRQSGDAERSGSATDQLTRDYALAEPQQRLLGLVKANDDPFGPGGDTWTAPEDTDATIRAALHRYGIVIPDEAPVEFVLEGFDTLTVKADAVTQAQIKLALDGAANNRQVTLLVRTFEIGDHNVIQEIVGAHSLNAATGGNGTDQISSGILPRAQAGAIATQLGDTDGVTRHDPTSITTRFRQRAKFEQIREFIYPTEYDPPEIPKEAPKNDAGTLFGAFPVTPANPTAFEMRPIGLTWEVEPAPLSDDAIALTYTLDRVQFLGFINYGSPIHCMAKNFFGKPVEVVLTENRIEQPVFRSDRASSTAEIPSGHVLVIVMPAQPDDPNVQGVLDASLPNHVPRLPRGGAVEPPKGMVYIIDPSLVD